ncbi:uncharacterized protein LOC119734551 [Patiria miniata]|uniref:SGNH hydrolase-type esterase domain-containing protein n=1 Tax=Patiria miniata TaxID=46514 RepID=A0A914AKQ9_PATMI|nr:uncharacterized protein LOC119734551 [Patiria miniata]
MAWSWRPPVWPSTSNSGKAKVFVIGDSLTKYLEANIESPLVDVDVYTQRGGTISSIHKSLRHSEFRIPEAPDIVLIHVGTNNLQYGFLHSNIEEFKLLLATLREVFPLTKIVVSAILPRHDSEALDTSRMHHNVAIGILCAKVGCNFVDFGNEFSRWAYAWDGLHLNWDGNALFGEAVQRYLQKMLEVKLKRLPFVPRELKKLVRQHTRKKKGSSQSPSPTKSASPPSPSTATTCAMQTPAQQPSNSTSLPSLSSLTPASPTLASPPTPLPNTAAAGAKKTPNPQAPPSPTPAMPSLVSPSSSILPPPASPSNTKKSVSSSRPSSRSYGKGRKLTPSLATVRKKLRRCIVHIFDDDGFCLLGLFPPKQVNCYVKPLAAMATLPYEIREGKSTSVGATLEVPKADSPYVSSRKRGKQRRRATRRIKKRRRRRKFKETYECHVSSQQSRQSSMHSQASPSTSTSSQPMLLQGEDSSDEEFVDNDVSVPSNDIGDLTDSFFSEDSMSEDEL